MCLVKNMFIFLWIVPDLIFDTGIILIYLQTTVCGAAIFCDVTHTSPGLNYGDVSREGGSAIRHNLRGTAMFVTSHSILPALTMDDVSRKGGSAIRQVPGQ